MFSLIKWLLIASFVGATWYLASFFLSMSSSEISQIKQNAIEAIDADDHSILTAPLTEKVKDDFTTKKASFFQQIKLKLKNLIVHTIDEPS